MLGVGLTISGICQTFHQKNVSDIRSATMAVFVGPRRFLPLMSGRSDDFRQLCHSSTYIFLTIFEHVVWAMIPLAEFFPFYVAFELLD